MKDYCTVIVRKAGEDPHVCGLENPCPLHADYPEPRSIAETALERTGVYLGERRDV